MKASQIMDNTLGAFEMDFTLSSALEIFEKTRFAFVSIVANREDEKVRRQPVGWIEVPVVAESHVLKAPAHVPVPPYIHAS